MSDSDISFETDEEELRVAGHPDIKSLPSRWIDIEVDELEFSARRIYSCVSSHGLLTSMSNGLEQRPINTRASGHIKEDRTRGESSNSRGKYGGGSPTTFVQNNFKNMGMDELLTVREDLMKESLRHKEHLKGFVKENFQSCINNMDTIREVSTRLRAASLEGGDGVHGATPAKVAEELRNTNSFAQNSFSGLIKRYNISQNLDSVLQLLGKYDSLVILPSMVRSSVDARDFEAVISLYQRAMGLIEKESIYTGDIKTIWKRLQDEVFKAMESAVTILEATLHNSTVSTGESLEAACYLEKFRVMGVPAASGKKSLDDFFEFQVSKVIENMSKIKEYAKSLEQGLVRDQRESHYQSQSPRNQSVSESRTSHDVICIESLTSSFYEWCYEIWDLFDPRIRSNDSLIQIQQEGRVLIKQVVERAFSAYSDLIESCIAGICSSYDNITESDQIVRFLIEACLDLEDEISDFLLPLCKDMIIYSCEQLIRGLESHLKLNAQNIFLMKGHCLDGFLPRQNIASLHQIIDESLFCISKIGKHTSRIKVRVPEPSHPINSILKIASEITSSSISKLSSRKPVLSLNGEEVDEYVLLLAWNTLEGIKTNVLPQVATNWSFLLNSGGVTPKENAAAFKWCCCQIEESQEYLIRSWVEIKLEKLEPVMESLLTIEEPKRAQEHEHELLELCMAKPCIWEIFTALESYDADIQHTIPVLREEVTGEMYLAVVEGIQNLVQSEHFLNSTLQSKAQLWLDLAAFQSYLIDVETKEKRSDMEGTALAQTILSRVEESVRSHMQRVPGLVCQVTLVKKWIAEICARDFPKTVNL